MTMKKMAIRYIGILAILLSLISCNLSKDKLELTSGNYTLHTELPNIRLSIRNSADDLVVPADSLSSIYLNGYPIITATVIDQSNGSILLKGETANKATALVNISFENGVVKVEVENASSSANNISFRMGGMNVAHGLGDAGGRSKTFNLVQAKERTFNIVNNGGSNRWTSTFTIFPENNFAGVFFTDGKKSITLGQKTYQMNIASTAKAQFYLLTGDMKDIYKNYKQLRNDKGYRDVKPKARLFELGWESWDALGWNTNQNTVKDILAKFHNEGYPIRWAVTGSGFWDQGGTTTSFGRYGKKFSDADTFRKWMHRNDIKWMIGLRTNFIPDGGPYYPKTKKRDKNLKVRSFYGNKLSNYGLEKGYFLKDTKGAPQLMTSGIFPIVPCYLLDGNVAGAAEWYQQQYADWKVDGIKEDTMMNLKEETSIFNAPISEIANKGGLVMARCGNFSAPGTLLRINDTGVREISWRIQNNYFSYAVCGAPNVYSDVAGVHNMHNTKDVERSIRHTWLLANTAGFAVGAFPSKWSNSQQKIFKKAVDFHYKITPYLYSAAEQSYSTGYPYTLTPLTIAYPNVADTLSNFDQWLIGESLMAAPVLKNYKSGKRDLYIPEGSWFDWETGERFEGPLVVKDYEIALDKTPCFAGGKGIVLTRNLKDQFKVRVYATNKLTESTFYMTKTGKAYTIKVKNSDIQNATVWNTTANKKVKAQKNNSFLVFDIEEGTNYELR